jgi:hypothetical protein
MKTELARAMLGRFDLIALREIANGFQKCSDELTGYAKEALDQGTGLMPDYLADATEYEQMAMLLKSMVRRKIVLEGNRHD